jgi:hypothetical protein
MTTKVLALTDALGNLVRFVLLPGQRYDNRHPVIHTWSYKLAEVA